jgi:WD40 repeat protein
LLANYDTEGILTYLHTSRNGKMMFAGTAKGFLQVIKFPFPEEHADNENCKTESQEHRAHSRPITRIRSSIDDRYLFTCSEDGCVFVFRTSEKGKDSEESGFVFAEEVISSEDSS